MQHHEAVQLDFDTAAINDDGGAAISEFRRRRLGWHGGQAVRLADGMLWSLPKIDVLVLMTSPKLQDDLIRAFELADEIQRERDGSREHALGLMLYHAHMANVGIRLLQVNYDLPDDNWKAMLGFADLFGMLDLTLKVSLEIGNSVRTWMPFFLTSGPDGRDNLRLN